jgi:hypothetical protein
MGQDGTSNAHVWYTPSDCAAMLEATPHGERWRARCPAHGGDNCEALGIAQGRDSYGNPITLLHCFAHDCPIEDICAAMGIKVRNLFCIHPHYAKATRNQPRTKSPRIDKLRHATAPYTSDEIAQLLLEEMIVSDPAWIQECVPAREMLWKLASASPQAREAFTRALREARLTPSRFWATLARDCEG